MAVDIVHLLELVQIEIDQPEDAGIFARPGDGRIQLPVQREAVVDIGQQVEFGAMHQVGVELAVLDGQRRQLRSHEERLLLLADAGI